MGIVINSALREQLQNERNKSWDFSVEGLLKDLRDVGSQKPMGYLPLSTITELCNTTWEALAAEAHAKGLQAMDFHRDPPALSVWDEKALQRLLDSKRDVLTQAGWPTSAREFAEHVFIEDVPEQTPLYDLIADSYGDYRNPGRLELGEPLKHISAAAQVTKLDSPSKKSGREINP